MESLCDVRSLESTVGARPLGVMLKSIDALDDHCRQMLAVAPVAVLGYPTEAGSRRAATIGGRRGFAEVESATQLRLSGVDSLGDAAPGGSSLPFLIPGIRETLRVNGRLELSPDRCSCRGGVHPLREGVHPFQALGRRAGTR